MGNRNTATPDDFTMVVRNGEIIESPTVTIVVPALNEARNLAEVLPTLPQVHQVIVVDGGSVDNTAEVVREVLPGADFVVQTRKGKGNALAAGFAHATGDIVVMFDADGSADAREIPAFVEALLNGADFAKGSRFCKGGGSSDITPIRRMGNWFLNFVTNMLFGTRFSDLCYGYNAFWRDQLPLLDLHDAFAPAPTDGRMLWGDGFEIETLINCRMAVGGARIEEVPSVELDRIHGESNLHAIKDGLRVLRTIRAERLRARILDGSPALQKAVTGTPQVYAQRISETKPAAATADFDQVAAADESADSAA